VATGANGDGGVIWYDYVRNQRYMRWFIGEGNSLGATSVPIPLNAIGLAFDAQGNYVLAEEAAGANGWNIYAQVLKRDGTVLVPRFKVNNSPSPILHASLSRVTDHEFPSLAINGKGDTVMIWDAIGQDGDGDSVYGQRLDRTGNFVGSKFRVNDNITGNQQWPGVSMTDEGNFVVTWMDVDASTQAGQVFMKQFRSNGGNTGVGVVRVTAPSSNYWQPPTVSPGGKLSLYWETQSSVAANGADVEKLRCTMDTQHRSPPAPARHKARSPSRVSARSRPPSRSQPAAGRSGAQFRPRGR
jgi:hypothetical protein